MGVPRVLRGAQLTQLDGTPSQLRPHSQHKDSEVGHSQDDSDVVIAIADRSTHDADCPNAGRGRMTRGEITLSDDCARTDETE